MMRNFLSILLGITYVLFSLGLDGENIGLQQGITMRSIGIVLIIFGFTIVTFYEKNLRIRLNKYVLLILISLIIINKWILLSYLFSPYQNLVSIPDIFAWVSIPILVLITFKISIFLKDRLFINTIIYSHFVTLLITFVWLFLSLGLTFDFFLIREFIDDNITVGLNRFLNGITLINIFSISIVLGISKTKRNIYIISLINFVSTLFLTVISGSRQSVLALLISIGLIFVINRYVIGLKRFSYKQIIAIFMLVLVVINLFQIEEVSTWFEERFINKTTQQLDTGDRRTDIYELALSDIKDNLLFGTGPGTYHQVSLLGHHTHNGYLYMANNFGLFPAVFLILIFLFLMNKSYKMKKIILLNQKKEIFIITLTTMIVFALVMNMFNDLITNLAAWMAIVLLIDSFSSVTDDKKI